MVRGFDTLPPEALFMETKSTKGNREDTQLLDVIMNELVIYTQEWDPSPGPPQGDGAQVWARVPLLAIRHERAMKQEPITINSLIE